MRGMATAKTSETDPLRIDRAGTPGGGAIGLTICPGKKDPHSSSGPWDRSLPADLDRIADAGATALVTLMESDELARLGASAADLERGARERRLEWYHLPIVDVHVPGPDFERLWLLAGPRLRARLARGELVVVHCRGGLGRSGTIAGRLLAEMGVAPDAALRCVRAARPGAVETEAQERHVLATRPAPPPGSLLDRLVGSLVAGAAGDALGAPVEFYPLDEIRARHGPAGVTGHLPDRHGIARITDDTQMTMFTADGLIRAFADGKDPAESVWRAYLRWLRTQFGDRDDDRRPDDGWLMDCEALWSQRAPGSTCIGGLRTGRMGTPDEPLNHSKGCGGVMRVAPVGFVAGRLGSTEAVFDLGVATAAATHGHPSGYLPAGFAAATIAELVAGRELPAALDAAEAILGTRRGHEATLAAVRQARDLARDASGIPEEIADLGEGWTGEEALAIALFSVLATGDPRAALLLAVNHDGDTDSTGAIAGNLVGAAAGAGAIPPDLWRPLELLHPLLRLATELADAISDPE